MEEKSGNQMKKLQWKILFEKRARKWYAALWELTNKKYIGSLLISIGFILFAVGSKDNDLIMSVIGILLGFMGAGLVTLAVNKNKSSEDINIHIGKQLFDKGLEGFVLGVVVGALKIIF